MHRQAVVLAIALGVAGCEARRLAATAEPATPPQHRVAAPGSPDKTSPPSPDDRASYEPPHSSGAPTPDLRCQTRWSCDASRCVLEGDNRGLPSEDGTWQCHVVPRPGNGCDGPYD